jgi:hypothetical protein
MIHLDAVVVQDSEPVTATIDNEVVMLSVAADAYFGLNGVGTEIWNMAREPIRVGEMCGRLQALYDADPETLTREVAQFVRQLLERGLLRLVPTKVAKP